MRDRIMILTKKRLSRLLMLIFHLLDLRKERKKRKRITVEGLNTLFTQI